MVQRVGRGVALLFHDRGTRRGWVVSSTPRPHFTPGKDPVPILQEGGWAAPGLVWPGGKSRPHRDSIPDRPACSSVLYWLTPVAQSLYRLSYPTHIHTHTHTHTHINITVLSATDTAVWLVGWLGWLYQLLKCRPIPVAARNMEWICGLSLAGVVGSNPDGARMFVSCDCRALSGTGLYVGPIIRPEESHRVWCVQWVWS